MTDRLAGVYVAFDRNIRDDDAQPILDAIKLLRHVIRVEPIISDPNTWIAESRARDELSQKIWDVLHPKDK